MGHLDSKTVQEFCSGMHFFFCVLTCIHTFPYSILNGEPFDSKCGTFRFLKLCKDAALECTMLLSSPVFTRFLVFCFVCMEECYRTAAGRVFTREHHTTRHLIHCQITYISCSKTQNSNDFSENITNLKLKSNYSTFILFIINYPCSLLIPACN